MGTTGEGCREMIVDCVLVGAKPNVPLVVSFNPNETSIPQDSSSSLPALIKASSGFIPSLAPECGVNPVLRTNRPVTKFLPTPSSFNAQLTSPFPVHTAGSFSAPEPKFGLCPGNGDDGRDGRKWAGRDLRKNVSRGSKM